VHELELELEVGEVLTLGDYTLTLLDIDGNDVCIRIDEPGSFSESTSPAGLLSAW
jgi:hypothetical protein